MNHHKELHSSLLPGLRMKETCVLAARLELHFNKSSCSPLSCLISCICYHPPTPISSFCVTAGIDSAPDSGDFQGIHMHRVFRDDDRWGTAAWLHFLCKILIIVDRYSLKLISGDYTYTYMSSDMFQIRR